MTALQSNGGLIIPKKRKIVPARNLSRRAMIGGKTFYDNTVDAFNVQLWARTSLAILYENMVMGNLVNRDFEPLFSRFGDTVNTRKPGQFKSKRKTNADAVTIQNATATNIPVKLNQNLHVSYLIKDGEESIAFTSLVDEFLGPAMLAHAQLIDHILSCQVYQFLGNSAGHLGGMDDDNAKDYILDSRLVLDNNKAWATNRNLVLTSYSESQALRNEEFTDAQRVGDDGTALREASLGRKLGFNIWKAQNQPFITLPAVGTSGGNIRVGAVNNAAGYPVNASSFTVDGLTGAITAGTWLTIAGDDTPLQVVSTVGGATPTTIVTAQGIKTAVLDNAVINVYVPGATTAAYTVDSTTLLGYAKEIGLTGVSVTPQIGQLVSFGTDNSHVYGIVDVNGTSGITLDRPIEANIASGAAVNFGPAGSYNFAFHPNAITLATRPLALPRPGTGALAGNAEWDGITIRVVITYDGNNQGHLVTLDILLGIKVIEPLLGSVLYG
jgi:hypothetical protein